MINVCVSGAEHDSSLCILNDEEVLLYVQEERISRIKKDYEMPFLFLNLIKKYTKVIDNIIFINYDPEKFNEINICLNTLKKDGVTVNNTFFNYKEHHLYHAASAFYASGFDDAICLVIDGWGASFSLSEECEGLDASETTSIYYASYPAEFEVLYKSLHYSKREELTGIELSIPNNYELIHSFDVGVAYGTVTNHLGFGRENPGKTMGLSSYGKEDKSLPNFEFEDTIYTNRNLLLNSRVLNEIYYPQLKNLDFQKKANLAYKVQKYLEKVFLYRVKQALKLKPDCKNLVFSGGCALNILGNSLIKKEFPDLNIFIDPVANDACQAYGSVKYYYHKYSESIRKSPLTTIYNGPKYSLDHMKKLVELEVMLYNNSKSEK
jgi:carbamoyltransferase